MFSNIKFKKRIIIHIPLIRRDTGISMLMKAVFERSNNYKVILCSASTLKRSIKLWRPHLVIVGSLGVAKSIREDSYGAKIFFYESEGFHINKNKEIKDGGYTHLFENDPDMINNIDLFLVWGKGLKKELEKVLKKKYHNLIKTIGCPKLDIVNYLKHKHKKENSVGVIGRYSNINSVTGSPVIMGLANLGNLSRILKQCKDFKITHDLISMILLETDFNISYRPHPLEEVKSSKEFFSKKFKNFKSRVNVDENLFFADWVTKQNYIIAPTTSSFTEIYNLRVPLILLDSLSGTLSFWRKFKMSKIWQDNSFLPKTKKELLGILQKKKKFKYGSKDVKNQQEKYCDTQNKIPASLRLLKLVDYEIEKLNLSKTFFIPRIIILYINFLIAKKNSWYDKLYFEKHFDNNVHIQPTFFNDMVNFIFKKKDESLFSTKKNLL